MTENINNYSPRSGRVIKEDGTVVNEANGINSDGSQNTRVLGSNVYGYGPVDLSTTDFVANGIAIAVTGTTGNVAVLTLEDQTVTIPAVLLPVGTEKPFTFKKILKTGTTATGVWAWWGK